MVLPSVVWSSIGIEQALIALRSEPRKFTCRSSVVSRRSLLQKSLNAIRPSHSDPHVRERAFGLIGQVGDVEFKAGQLIAPV